MGDHQGGDAQAALQLAQFGTQMLTYAGIQGRHRLIEQQQRRRRCQGTGQGDPLLLATGKLAREFLFAASQAHQFQHVANALAHHIAIAASQAVGNVGLNGQIGEKGVGLKQDPVVTGLRCQLGDIAITQVQRAVVLALKPRDAAQQRGLAAAGRPEQAHQLACGHLQRDVIQRGKGAKALAHIAHLHRHAGLGQSGCVRAVHGCTSSSRWGSS